MELQSSVYLGGVQIVIVNMFWKTAILALFVVGKCLYFIKLRDDLVYKNRLDT